mgnify:CR=1 FL=1
MTVTVIGLTCVNCGFVVGRPDARTIAYATDVMLEAPNQAGTVQALGTATFSVHRLGARDDSLMLLCDGCMGAAVRAVCQSLLADMEAMRGATKRSLS